tara:strand:+ start:172 stop:600 length:429 start_codon:yes stop_codon:yes gene_type:complete
MLIGYSRTNHFQSKEDSELQIMGLTKYGCKDENIYRDRTAIGEPRSQLMLALNALRKGDKLVVEKLTSLCSDIKELGSVLQQIEHKSATLIVLDVGGQQMNSSNKIGRAMFKLLQSIAELPYEETREKRLEELVVNRRKVRP